MFPVTFIKIWRHNVIWHTVTSFWHLSVWPPVNLGTIFSFWNMHSTWNFHSGKMLTRKTNPEIFMKIWRHDVILQHMTSFGHLPACHLLYLRLHKSGKTKFSNKIVICRKFNVLVVIWWVNDKNRTTFDEVIRFYFFLLNFLDFTRFLLIFAQNLLTSSFFLIFSENIDKNENSCQNLWLLHFSFRKYQGNAILH